MTGDQIINILGNFGSVMVIVDGIARQIDRMYREDDGSFIVHATDRNGKQWMMELEPGETWYVTRKDLVNWEQDRRSPFQDL